MTVRSAVCGVLSLSLVVGCGSRSGPEPEIERVVPVSGSLTYQGKPLSYHQVTFLPVDGRRAAVGVTDMEGRFTMGTNDTGDGAPPGRHKVAIAFVGPPTNETPGQEQIIDNPALLPKPDIEIPGKYSNPETSGLTQEVPEDGLPDLVIDLQ